MIETVNTLSIDTADFDRLPCPLLIMEPHTERIAAVNAAAVATYRMRPEELTGRTLQILRRAGTPPACPADSAQPGWTDHLRSDGTILPVVELHVPVLWRNAAMRLVMAVGFPSNAPRGSQEADEALVEALRAVGQHLGWTTEGSAMFEAVLPWVLEVTRADCGAVYTWDSAAGALVPRAWQGYGEGLASKPVTPGVGLAGAVAASNEGQLVPDPKNGEMALADERAAGVWTLLGEPISWHGRVLGVVTVGRTRAGTPLGPREQTLVRVIAGQMGMALEVDRLCSELSAEQQERQDAEGGLLRRTRQLEAASEIGAEADLDLDSDGLVSLIAKRAIGLLDAVGSAVYLVDTDADGGKGVLLARAAQGVLRRSMLDRRALGEGLIGEVAANQAGRIVNDYQRSSCVLPSVLEPVRAEAAIAEPMLYRGRLVGVVHVVRDAAGGPFVEEDGQALRLFARHAALVLDHASVVNELKGAYGQLQGLQSDAVQGERLQTLSQLLSGIVYQLSEHLSVILGQADAAGLNASATPELRESLALMMEAATSGEALVRNLKAFTERTGSTSDGLEPVDLASIVMQAASITKPRWRDELDLQGRHVEVEVAIPELPAILGRPADLRDVFSRLILHALETMPHGGRITITGEFEGHYGDDSVPRILVTVRDTGVGIPKAVQDHLFDPAIASRPGLRRRGIGLSTVGEIVRAHGGTIAVSAVPMEGTTITIRLQGSRQQARRQRVEVRLPPVTGRRVLVVDDHPSVLRTLVAMLKDSGQVVRSADSGETALRVLAEGPVDLVFTDLGMPGMSGWQLAQAVKAQYPQTRVVLLTGWGEQALRAETKLNVFVDRVLFKPAGREKLLAALTELTGPAA